MKVMNYDEWKDTALTLHLILQMFGKVKLARMEPQPQWNHVLLQLTPNGFTTGLIPDGKKTFALSLLIREGKVTATGIDGRNSSFALESGKSIKDYFNEFNRMLSDVMCETEIYTVPQEMNTTTPFDKDDASRVYNHEHAANFFKMCVFAHNALLRFVAPFRGKRIMPSFFWGTFDVSTVLFNGKPAPFNGGGIIEKVAFDEQMIEFGFWPGDDGWPQPTFFVLPYPFIKDDLSNAGIKPDAAFYSTQKAEFFLKLEDVLKYPAPEEALQSFLQSGYEIVTKHEKWDNLPWFNKPLLAKKGSTKLQ